MMASRKCTSPLFRLSLLLPIGLAALFLVPAAFGEAGNGVRILAVQPPPHWSPRDPDRNRTVTILSSFLTERIERIPGVLPVSSDRTAAILQALRSPALQSSREELLEGFRKTTPVDSLVVFSTSEGRERMMVYSDSGTRQLDLSQPGGMSRKLLEEAGRLIAGSLALNESQSPLLSGEVFELDGEALAALYLNRFISARRPDNPGEARLRFIQPAWARFQNNPALAAEVLKACAAQVENERLSQNYTGTALQMAKMSLPNVAGTRHEASAHAILTLRAEEFEETLLTLCAPLVEDPLDAAMNFAMDNNDNDSPFDGFGEESRPHVPQQKHIGDLSREVRLGALRLAGFLRSDPAYAVIAKAAGNDREDLRRAAAAALGFQEDETGLDLLRKLQNDSAPEVALCAALSLHTRSRPIRGVAPIAIDLLSGANADARTRRTASRLLAESVSAAEKDDLEALVENITDVLERRNVIRAWLPLAAPEEALPWLGDPDTEVILQAMTPFRSANELSDRALERIVHLANDPLSMLAEAARGTLARHRPKDTFQAALFDLRSEHPYRRIRILEETHRYDDATATKILRAGVRNDNPYIRVKALTLLAASSPSEGVHGELISAIRDPHQWVRLHAAALLDDFIREGDAPAVREVLAETDDPAIAGYLRQALYAIGTGPEPPALPRARSVTTARNLTWLCGMGYDSERSPFQAYYLFSVPKDKQQWARTYAAGKTFFIRFSPIGHPGLIVVDPQWRENFWLNLNNQVDIADLPMIDGFVFGEETMSMAPDTLWRPGWRLFCQDAGIDPDRIRGEIGNLNPYQRQAWRNWASEKSIEGFNILYDYVKTRFAVLRPGIQVATFLPGEAAPPANGAAGWKFDVAGIYDYKGDNRMAGYNLVRRLRTLWPERPVIWLSLGIGGYEMNPVKRTQKVPQSPFFSRSNRAYADSVTAWLAGAQTGWFSVWIFVEANWRGGMQNLSGIQVIAEDLTLENPRLTNAVNFAFKGAEDDLTAPEAPASPQDAFQDEAAFTEEELVEILDPGKKKQAARAEVLREKAHFHRGFLFYGRYMYELARFFSSLPSSTTRPEALGIRSGVTVWTRPRSAHPRVPALAVLNAYDFLHHPGDIKEIDLSRYRLIVLYDPGPVEDRTITALREWLHDFPGLLVIVRAVEHDNKAQMGTVENHDGRLREDWPWEDAIDITRLLPRGEGPAKPEPLLLRQSGAGERLEMTGVPCSTFDIKQPNRVHPLLTHAEDDVVLALWSDPAFKGRVLFDGMESADGVYLRYLRAQLNALHAREGVGIPVDGPLLQQSWNDNKLEAAAASRYYRSTGERKAYHGLDLFSGTSDPSVGAGSSAAILARQPFLSGHLAAVEGVTALGDKPFSLAQPENNGIWLFCEGLFRVSAGEHPVGVTPEKGASPPPAIDKDRSSDWIVGGEKPGIAVVKGEGDNLISYIRTDRPIFVAPEKPSAHAPRE